MHIVESKVVRLDKLAEFANANFDREPGQQFNLPYSVEIDYYEDLKTGHQYTLALRQIGSDGLVKTLYRTAKLPNAFARDKFVKIENSMAGYGPGIELLGMAAWYWLLTKDNQNGRELGIEIATKAWDAWTLVTAIIDGSKARDKFQQHGFLCPGVIFDQAILCASIPGDPSVWLKRMTVRSLGNVNIVSRWTFVKVYQGNHDLFHEEKHAIMQTTSLHQEPASAEKILKAKAFPFNP